MQRSPGRAASASVFEGGRSGARIEPPAAPIDGADAEVEHDADLDAIDALDRLGADARGVAAVELAVDVDRCGQRIGEQVPAERLAGITAAERTAIRATAAATPELADWIDQARLVREIELDAAAAAARFGALAAGAPPTTERRRALLAQLVHSQTRKQPTPNMAGAGFSHLDWSGLNNIRRTTSDTCCWDRPELHRRSNNFVHLQARIALVDWRSTLRKLPSVGVILLIRPSRATAGHKTAHASANGKRGSLGKSPEGSPYPRFMMKFDL